MAQGLDRLETEVIPLFPAILLMEFGFNDAYVCPWLKAPRVGLEEYKKNLREFGRLAKAHKSLPVFIVNHTTASSAACHPQGNRKRYETNFLPYNRAVKAVARQVGSPAIDLPAMMKKRRISLKSFLDVDGLHLTVPGNHAYADMVFCGLKSILGD